MKITFITIRIMEHAFTGGLYCCLRHANELVDRGHEVTIVAYPKSVYPEWIDLKARLVIPSRLHWDEKLPVFKRIVSSVAHAIDYSAYDYKGAGFSQATINSFLPECIPDSDVTIATYWETAALVARHGKGRLAYFCQHYESLFYDNKIDASNVNATYFFGLNIIANSSWLKDKIERVVKNDDQKNRVELALNAIDKDVFCQADAELSGLRIPCEKGKFRLISYGGRNAEWKGFREMVEAVGIARATLMNEVEIEWSVYGSAIIPPDNDVASYEYLGFLDQEHLAKAYRAHDALLSASWYESYPLFPIEAMASGLAVITTQLGTEDYAFNEYNCLIVEPKNSQSIASAIIRLASDFALANKLANNAKNVVNEHNWMVAGDRMESVLRHMVEGD